MSKERNENQQKGWLFAKSVFVDNEKKYQLYKKTSENGKIEIHSKGIMRKVEGEIEIIDLANFQNLLLDVQNHPESYTPESVEFVLAMKTTYELFS